MKILEAALLIGFAASVCVSALSQTADAKQRLEENVLRLHILANSDSIDDQALKLKVRDRVLAYTAEILPESGESLEAVEATVTEHLAQIEDVAQEIVREEGCDDPVTAELVEMEFEDRTYDTLVMPAGEYDALRITIGEAEGQNWWCVMYPALCVPQASEVKVDKQTESTAFDTSQQDLLEHHGRYTVKLKCLEWLERWFG